MEESSGSMLHAHQVLACTVYPAVQASAEMWVWSARRTRACTSVDPEADRPGRNFFWTHFGLGSILGAYSVFSFFFSNELCYFLGVFV